MTNPPYEAGDLSASREGGLDLQRLDAILAAVRHEVIRAACLHGPMHTHHEAYAVILEEFQEYWEDVRRDDIPAARKELKEVAAMAVRALHDVTQERTAKPAPLDKVELRKVRALLAIADEGATKAPANDPHAAVYRAAAR
jgi:hypothetical protein